MTIPVLNKKNIINNDWSIFNEIDPFNPGNLVQGYISHHNGDDYGALFIEKVNNAKVEQLIYCTPKIRYPFDANDNWHFPKAKRIERYEKLDGTNIFMYSYVDANGDKFATAKLRLQPFLKNSKFGPFLDMWKEATKDYYTNLRLAILNGNINLSFELWGAANQHLIKYDSPMQASLLFGRRQPDQQLLPPSELLSIVDMPVANFFGLVDGNYVQCYKTSQIEIDDALIPTDDFQFIGQEGEVWYLLDRTEEWILFKCKPHQIEQIHWAAGGIGKSIVIATCQNAFENLDDPTIEDVSKLLIEEFNEHEVNKIRPSIEKHLNEVKTQYIFRQNVMEKYNELNLNIIDDKQKTMRAMSGHFEKSEMTKVYSAIIANII